VLCASAFDLCSRGGLRILANKAQLQASMPPSKRPRRDGVLRYLRQHVAGMIPPPPGQEPECLWAMPTNLLQVCWTQECACLFCLPVSVSPACLMFLERCVQCFCMRGRTRRALMCWRRQCGSTPAQILPDACAPRALCILLTTLLWSNVVDDACRYRWSQRASSKTGWTTYGVGGQCCHPQQQQRQRVPRPHQLQQQLAESP
jgi:hypothetical protein